ncbi:GNAT family N-acetyltransferase [Algoriphagus sp. CAU 1675]|uniref:GNAT family N-acetyltransferase n=1 Tax=Algoriphagus sp. CAU 1675 TaxID=3032597 RepID=UPI0023DA1301|nr:GNAT family N-acetyltransferase [Algoriphagus sp. CAU 1675]MDF2158486.1 GNAT family N-acetyltransferase [Algoriphagus sp. CAU 1675]
MSYIFTSPRLGFRTWKSEDLAAKAALNADKEVMKYFPKPLSEKESQEMMDRMNQMYDEKGICYFAVDSLESGDLVGIIGLGWKSFEADFTPCVDIGWRLARPHWNKGYATEGAKASLEYGKQLGIKKIVSMASVDNLASIGVMKKIGMKYWKNFKHPELTDKPHLEIMALYQIDF